MAERQRTYTWYLEPLNDASNESISRNCGEGDLQVDIICSDNKRHTLWRVTAQVRKMMEASKKTNKWLKFRTFCKEGDGQIRDVTNVLSHSTQAA